MMTFHLRTEILLGREYKSFGADKVNMIFAKCASEIVKKVTQLYLCGFILHNDKFTLLVHFSPVQDSNYLRRFR